MLVTAAGRKSRKEAGGLKMRMDDLLSDLGRPMTYYPSLARKLGGINRAAFLCQLIFWTGKQADKDGWIYKSAKEFEEELGIGYEEQKSVRRHLLKLGLIEEYYERLSHRMRFRPNLEKIQEFWQSNSRTGERLIPEQGKVQFGNATKSSSGTPQSPIRLKDSEKTSEKTSERTPENNMSAGADDVLSPEEEVFKFWRDTMEHPNAIFTPERKRLVRARLKDGYTVEQIKKSILGCRASPFHMGQNERGTRYDGFELICRNGSKLEFFIGLWEKPPQVKNEDYGKQRETASQRNVRNIKDGLALIRAIEQGGHRGENNCENPLGLLTTGTRP